MCARARAFMCVRVRVCVCEYVFVRVWECAVRVAWHLRQHTRTYTCTEEREAEGCERGHEDCNGVLKRNRWYLCLCVHERCSCAACGLLESYRVSHCPAYIHNSRGSFQHMCAYTHACKYMRNTHDPEQNFERVRTYHDMHVLTPRCCSTPRNHPHHHATDMCLSRSMRALGTAIAVRPCQARSRRRWAAPVPPHT